MKDITDLLVRLRPPHTENITFNGISFDILRLDLMDPESHGNKWFKLQEHFRSINSSEVKTIVSFGGAFSNHIAALSELGKLTGLKTVGIIRGEEHLPLNPTLRKATERGMDIYYLNRTAYRRKDISELESELKSKYGDYLLIPEGGSDEKGVQGAKSIVNYIEKNYQRIALAAGTGGTSAGILSAMGSEKLICLPVVKGDGSLRQDILNWAGSEKENLLELQPAARRGYAKTDDDLIQFIEEFQKNTGILLDQVYTGKALMKALQLAELEDWDAHSWLFIHTGGLQGIS